MSRVGHRGERRHAVASGIPMHLFEAFDEKLKSGDSGAGAHGHAVEHNWGVFTEGGVAKYRISELDALHRR